MAIKTPRATTTLGTGNPTPRRTTDPADGLIASLIRYVHEGGDQYHITVRDNGVVSACYRCDRPGTDALAFVAANHTFAFTMCTACLDAIRPALCACGVRV